MTWEPKVQVLIGTQLEVCFKDTLYAKIQGDIQAGKEWIIGRDLAGCPVMIRVASITMVSRITHENCTQHNNTETDDG